MAAHATVPPPRLLLVLVVGLGAADAYCYCPAGVVTCGVATGVMSIIGLIEGIIYLTKTTDEFRESYLEQQKTWF